VRGTNPPASKAGGGKW